MVLAVVHDADVAAQLVAQFLLLLVHLVADSCASSGTQGCTDQAVADTLTLVVASSSANQGTQARTNGSTLAGHNVVIWTAGASASCRQGQCGGCECQVQTGHGDHANLFH